MRVVSVVVVVVLALFLGARWLFAPAEPERPQQAEPAAPAPPPSAVGAAPALPVPAQGGSAVLPLDAITPTPKPLSPLTTPAPAPQAVRPEGARSGTAGDTGSGAAPPGPPAPAKPADPREQGTLQLAAWYSYAPPGHPSTDAKMRVRITGTLDCSDGVGSLHYSDGTQYTEWRAHHFEFDPAAICLAERDGGFVTGFNLVIRGAYQPLMLDPRAEAKGAGRFTALFASSDPGGTPLPAVLFCLDFDGGAYARYNVPQSTHSPYPSPRCTYLSDGASCTAHGCFSIRRGK